MRQWLTKIQCVVTDKRNKPGVILFILLVLFGMIGTFENYYVKRRGVYITATILDVGGAPRGYVVYIKYSYMNKQYEKAVSASLNLANKENIGKKLIFTLLEDCPTMIAYIDFAPNCLDDSPPEGWTEIPECE